jgi:hypothetical protein
MMSPTLKFLLIAVGLGGLGGLLMARFVDAVRAGESLIAAACATGYVIVFLLIWRAAQGWRKSKGLK